MFISNLPARLLASASFALVLSTPAFAADAPADESTIVVTGSREANASISGMKIDPIRLPINVRVLDDELIETTGITRLSDLFDLAGGMARQNSFGGAWDAYAIRGFSGDINQGPDLLINRFTSNRGFNARRDTATVERFEILKGPASALSGKGEPGGSINVVTKAPLDHFHAGGELSYSSFNTRRGSFDLGGPVSGGLAVRAIGVYEASDGFRDFGNNDRILLAPSVAWTPKDSIRFLYQLEYNVVNFVHDRGLVAVGGNGLALPRTRFLGEPNDGQITQRTTQHQGTATFDLAPGVALEAGVQYRDGTFAGQSTHNSVLVGTLLRRQLRIHDYNWDDLSGRVELSVNRSFLGLEHQLRIGGDALKYNQRRIFYRFSPTAANPYGIDIYNPVYGQPKPVATLNQNLLEQLRGESIYAQDLISLGDQFSLLLGLRHDALRQTVINYRTNTSTYQSPSKTTPRAAFTFAPSKNFSAYVSWGRSFRYNQGTNFAGAPFAPESGEAYEGGIKFAALDGRIDGTVSAFQITKSNVLTSDPLNAGFSIAVGTARSEGIEADINVRIDKRFALTAVYALIDAKITKDNNPVLVGSRLSNVARHSGAIYGTWRSDGDRKGSFTLAGGLTYVGERAGDDINSGFRLPSYVTARANIAYQATGNISLHLDADNIFDATYLESSYSDVWITPGSPRSVKARVSFKL
ncbi:MAG: TonB-dependent siderophore receptor [Sphingomonadales bacterium]